MSNLIKSRYVALSEEDKYIIDSNEKSEEFRIINFTKSTQVHVIPEDETAASKEGFIPGIDALVIEEENESAGEEKLKIRLEDMLAKAEEETALLRKIAEDESKAHSRKLFDDALKNGYQEGYNQGMQEALKKQKEYEELKVELVAEYEAKAAALEPEFASIMAALIEKITGIAVEEEQGVITHLIHRAILHSDNSKYFHIKVSKEDYEEVLAYKPKLMELLNETIEVDISLDKGLRKNQCIIDLETGIIDCSLDIQMANLKKDIKLLSIESF